MQILIPRSGMRGSVFLTSSQMMPVSLLLEPLGQQGSKTLGTFASSKQGFPPRLYILTIFKPKEYYHEHPSALPHTHQLPHLFYLSMSIYIIFFSHAHVNYLNGCFPDRQTHQPQRAYPKSKTQFFIITIPLSQLRKLALIIPSMHYSLLISPLVPQMFLYYSFSFSRIQLLLQSLSVWIVY